MIIGMTDSLAFSQERIKFKRRRTSITINGNVNKVGRDFVINGCRGQTMTIRVTSPKNTVALAVGNAKVGKELTIKLESADDYEFNVSNFANYSSDFTLYVSIK